MNDSVQQRAADGVATLVLDRPDALNALDEAMAGALDAAVARAVADPQVRCIVIAGAGEHFMAGGDVRLFHEWLSREPAARAAELRRVIAPVHRSIRTLRAAPQPVIAAVRGACAGFGLSLAMACDLAVAGEGSTFSLAYCRIGASPDGGATWTLPRLVGLKRAAEIALLGERFSAADALAAGLVNRVVPDAEVDAVVAEMAARLASGPAAALARTKGLLAASTAPALEAHLEAEAAAFAEGVAGVEFEEGVRAFVEKRAPRW
jgi:2-(1,2-epoxy-1,2-dihydrophenyl)acetyl-CoA isomerase